MLLIFFAAIPGGILTFSCTYMCGCSRFIYVGEDGHMRLHCCGKSVTGIGKILKLYFWPKNDGEKSSRKNNLAILL